MRRPWQIAGPLLLVFCCVCFAFQVENDAEKGFGLKVSIASETLQQVPSCLHSFGQVELQNTHPMDGIEIHSIQVGSEETLMVTLTNGDSLQPATTSRADSSVDHVPQQLHVSSLPSEGSISLGPGQVVIVPVTFLPMFPSEEDMVCSDDETCENSFAKSFQWETPHDYQRNRNNLEQLPPEEEFQVRTRIIVDTSRGVMQVPLSVSSVRKNPYGLPDVIRFLPLHGTGDPTQRDCFDVYMNNPASTDEMMISEILVSRPDLVAIELDSRRIQGGQSSSSDQQDTLQTNPAQVIREWMGKPLALPPDSMGNYIATVCTCVSEEGVPMDDEAAEYLREVSTWIDLGGSERGMGFLQIRSNDETLFVVLEQQPERLATIVAQEIPIQTRSRVMAKIPSPPPAVLPLQSFPDTLDFLFVGDADQSTAANITLHNSSPQPIRLKEVEVQMLEADETINEVLRQLDVSIVGWDDEYEIQSGETTSGAFSVQCAARLSGLANPLPEFPRQHIGSLFVRGVLDVDWIQGAASDNVDAHFELEIPLSVSLMDGRVEMTLERTTHPYPQLISTKDWDSTDRIVSALFFPMERIQSSEGSESPMVSQNYKKSREIVHDLRVMSHAGSNLELLEFLILEENGEEVSDDQSACAQFNASRTRQIKSSRYADYDDIGYVTLQYKFDESTSLRRGRGRPGLHELPRMPTTCFLSIVTKSPSDVARRIPLIVFPPDLEVSSSVTSGESVSPNIMSSNEIMIGFKKLLAWCQDSGVGKSFIETLKDGAGPRRASQNETKLLEQYLEKLNGSSLKRHHRLRPILLNVGAVENGDTVQVPVRFTNRNPVPISVTVDIPEIEGMSLTIGRDRSHVGDGNSLLDYLPKSTPGSKGVSSRAGHGRYAGHPLQGLRQFLLSNNEALAFAAKFPYRNAISENKEVTDEFPMLRSLYAKYAHANFQRSSRANPFDRDSPSCHLFSNTSGNLSEAVDGVSESLQQSPMMISDDKRRNRVLKVCSEDDNEKLTIAIPPGASARFEVTLRAPDKELLEDDINKLLATGLVISTNFGQIMPILVAFEAVQGQISAKNDKVGRNVEAEGHSPIVVPLRYNWDNFDADDGFLEPMPSVAGSDHFLDLGDKAGVPLYLSSSFSRNVKLQKVSSCNPWFDVQLQNGTDGVSMEVDVDTHIGSIYGLSSCLPKTQHLPSFPSFYQCVVNLLSRRQELQPPRCGSQLAGDSTSDMPIQGAGVPKHVLKSLIQAFEVAIFSSMGGEENEVEPATRNSTATTRYLPAAHGGEYAVKSGRKFSDGYIPELNLRAYALARFAWRVASEEGLTRLSSSLQAIIEYNVTDAPSESETPEPQSLTLALHSKVESVLEDPRLFESETRENGNFGASVLEFPPTLVGTWAALKIPLRNPLSVPVRVRLAAAIPTSDLEEHFLSRDFDDDFLYDLEAPYVQSYRLSESQKVGGKHLWWDGGGSFFQADSNGDVIRSQHNVTIRSGTGAQVRIINPSIHSSSAFINGCSSRCGVADDYKQTNSPQDPKLSSVIGAGSAAGIVLTGHQRTLTPEYSPREPYFQSGGVPIPGSGGPSAFAIPLSALDEVVIPPYGVAEVGPVFFRPTGRYSTLGCDAVQKSGSRFWNQDMEKDCRKKVFEAIMFLENSLTGAERVVLKGKGMWEHLYFQDPPPRAGFDTYGDIELRNGRSTLVFSGSGTRATDGFRKIIPTVKHVLLRNGGDVAVAVKSIYLASEREIGKSRNPETVSLDACSIGSFRLLDCWESDQEMYQIDGSTIGNIRSGFVLEPGQSHSIFVEHIADCSVKEEFVTLVADLSERRISAGSSDTIADSGRGRSHRSRYNGRSNPFGNERVSLEVGYSMGKNVFPQCSPVNVLDKGFAEIELPPVNPTSEFFEPGPIRRLARGTASRRTPTYAKSIATLVAVCMVAFAMLLLTVGLEIRNGKVARNFSADPLPLERADSKGLGEKKRLSQQSLWNAAFRCLARADPSPTELQALGREQTRQVVAGRYRVRGGVPPTALSTRGTYVRDRSNSVSGPYVKRQERGSGTEKVRTLSDAMFRRLTPNYGNSARSLLPAGLDWRVAYARGIIEDKSGGIAKVGQSTKELLRRREQAKKAEVEQNVSLDDDDAVDDDTRSLQDDVTDDQTTDSESSDTPTEPDQQVEPAETDKVDDPVTDIPEPEEAPDSKGSDKGPIETNQNHVSADSQPSDSAPSSIPSLVSDEQPKTSEHTKEINSKKGAKAANRDGKPKAPDVSSPPETVTVQDNKQTTRSTPSSKEPKPSKEQSPEPEPKAKATAKSKSAENKPSAATAAVAEPTTAPSKPATKEARSSKKATHEKTKSKKSGNNNGNNADKESRPRKKGSQSKKSSKRDEVIQPAPTTTGNQGFEAFGGVAPPPGLSPPPGFGTGAPTGLLPAATASTELPLSLSTDSATLGDMLSAALNSDLGLPVAPPSTATSASPLAYSQFGTPSASDMLFGVTSALPTVGSDANLLGSTSEHLPSGGDPVLDRLLHDSAGRRNGFDVMDFLDSILDDGDGGGGGGGETTNDNTADLLNGDALFQPNNPWAAESRASAYGIISMDPSAEDTDSETSPSLYPQRGLGLRPFALTPMAGDEEEEDDRAFSFYAQLTEEED